LGNAVDIQGLQNPPQLEYEESPVQYSSATLSYFEEFSVYSVLIKGMAGVWTFGSRKYVTLTLYTVSIYATFIRQGNVPFKICLISPTPENMTSSVQSLYTSEEPI
jgi:hypothetical protein